MKEMLATTAAIGCGHAYACVERRTEGPSPSVGVLNLVQPFKTSGVKPWSAFKSGSDAERASAALALCTVLELLRVAAVALLPVTPALSRRVFEQLGLPPVQVDGLTWADAAWGGLKKGHATAAPSPVFGRLEGDMVTEAAAPKEAKPAKGGGKQGKKAKQPKADADTAPAAEVAQSA
eukprot:365756-Chlamydomonas_euryale.AAC.25